MCVILVNKPKATSYHILPLLVCLLFLWNKYSLMYGVLLLPLLASTNIM
jgi:hypothetical protein